MPRVQSSVVTGAIERKWEFDCALDHPHQLL